MTGRSSRSPGPPAGPSTPTPARNSLTASTCTPACSKPAAAGGGVNRVREDPDAGPRARIPADVDQPDKIVYGLTARQLAILAAAAGAGYLLVRGLGPVLPQPVLIAALIPVAGIAVTVALGRRDG